MLQKIGDKIILFTVALLFELAVVILKQIKRA
jgi:hypothetical protein